MIVWYYIYMYTHICIHIYVYMYIIPMRVGGKCIFTHMHAHKRTREGSRIIAHVYIRGIGYLNIFILCIYVYITL